MSGSRFVNSYYYPTFEVDQTSGEAKPQIVSEDLNVMEIPAAYRESVKTAQLNRLSEWSQRCQPVPQKHPSLAGAQQMQFPEQTTTPYEASLPPVAESVMSSYYPESTLPISYTAQYRMVTAQPSATLNNVAANSAVAPVEQLNHPSYNARAQQCQVPFKATPIQPQYSTNNAAILNNMVDNVATTRAPTVPSPASLEKLRSVANREINSGYAWEREEQKKVEESANVTKDEMTATAGYKQSVKNNIVDNLKTSNGVKQQAASTYIDVPNDTEYAYNRSSIHESYQFNNNANAHTVAFSNVKNAEAPLSSYEFTRNETQPTQSICPTPLADSPTSAVATAEQIPSTNDVLVERGTNSPFYDYDVAPKFEAPTNIGHAFSVGLSPASEYHFEELKEVIA